MPALRPALQAGLSKNNDLEPTIFLFLHITAYRERQPKLIKTHKHICTFFYNEPKYETTLKHLRKNEMKS